MQCSAQLLLANLNLNAFVCTVSTWEAESNGSGEKVKAY